MMKLDKIMIAYFVNDENLEYFTYQRDSLRKNKNIQQKYSDSMGGGCGLETRVTLIL